MGKGHTGGLESHGDQSHMGGSELHGDCESQGGSESHGVEVTRGGCGHTQGIGVTRGSGHTGDSQGGQGHTGSGAIRLKVTWRGWGHIGGVGGPTGEGKLHRAWAVTVPPLGPTRSIGGHQYFRPPVQIDVVTRATEDALSNWSLPGRRSWS